ncbi:MAG: bifunctional molybdenum cofactor guanylyltransferase MobA/molybdopterin-guanine dinucleotide biosynthesis adaptor protein MobB [Chlorobiaceae bacterium]|nr:bifunctional molybdenum cofactor guanylyltransferase MobA/molybdopterin-guanine dinucleotide biosynthesis adaptor protein MobB [Chlorobiaceae bacterium]
MQFHPFEIAFCGYSGSGKTTLIASVIRHLGAKYSIACYKHGCHRFDIDREGKDSWLMANAGAGTVMISDPEKKAVVTRQADRSTMLERQAFSGHDMLFVEGLKELPLQKLLLVDSEKKILDLLHNGTASNVCALVTPDEPERYGSLGIPVFRRDNIAGISAFIETTLLRRAADHIPVYGLVLAGGLSSRMGSDKALLTYHLDNQLVRTASLLRSCCSKVFISCRAEQEKMYGRFGFPLISDSYLGIGPMGGLLSAMQAEPHAAWLAAACDLPFIDGTTAELLLSHRHPMRFATVFRNPETQHIEPLFACYEPKSRSRLLLMHAEGCNSLSRFLEQSRIEELELANPGVLENINTPAEADSVNFLKKKS